MTVFGSETPMAESYCATGPPVCFYGCDPAAAFCKQRASHWLCRMIRIYPHMWCICAMLLRKLGGALDREHIREVFVRQIRPRLVSWTQEQQELLLSLFLRSLELDPHKRLDSSRILSEKLYEILMQRGVDYENIH